MKRTVPFAFLHTSTELTTIETIEQSVFFIKFSIDCQQQLESIGNFSHIHCVFLLRDERPEK